MSLGIPHATSLPEPALRFAPSLRHGTILMLKVLLGTQKDKEKHIHAAVPDDSSTLHHDIMHMSHRSHHGSLNTSCRGGLLNIRE